jgi:eukaryotic-like serine/threonine-protein kinase
MFDNFALLETVGIGGMGTVYKARDTLLDRLVALKLLRKGLEGGIDQAAQLQQEARVAASVNHPNVVQVFSSGTDHDQFYLVMELVERGSLDDFIEQQKRVPKNKCWKLAFRLPKVFAPRTPLHAVKKQLKTRSARYLQRRPGKRRKAAN